MLIAKGILSVNRLIRENITRTTRPMGRNGKTFIHVNGRQRAQSDGKF